MSQREGTSGVKGKEKEISMLCVHKLLIRLTVVCAQAIDTTNSCVCTSY